MSKPLFDRKIQYCIRCCMPETTEGQSFDELGICRACSNSEEKMHINWIKREQDLKDILDEAKKKGRQ